MELTGKIFGRWTVLDDYVTTDRNQRKWLCRCSCGKERYVLERSLVYGSSQSCGCMAIERAARAKFKDLTGQTFGELTVLRQSDVKKGANTTWLCRCSCGSEYIVAGTLLVTGRRTHCASPVHEKNYAYTDITGRRFGFLTAVAPTEKRSAKGNIIWQCSCRCGNTVFASYNDLMYTNLISCGCRKKAHEQNLKNLLTYADGTSIDKLKSSKTPVNNTSGRKGVYFIRGKYLAKIVFQKKAYNLGSFERFEDAVHAREKAEQLLVVSTVRRYERWKKAADENPVWAKENPFRIKAEKNGSSEIRIAFLPEI